MGNILLSALHIATRRSEPKFVCFAAFLSAYNLTWFGTMCHGCPEVSTPNMTPIHSAISSRCSYMSDRDADQQTDRWHTTDHISCIQCWLITELAQSKATNNILDPKIDQLKLNDRSTAIANWLDRPTCLSALSRLDCDRLSIDFEVYNILVPTSSNT